MRYMKNELPEVVWNNSTLYLPPVLIEAYVSVLRDLGLLSAAMNANPISGPVGGRSLSETREHFVTRFGVSAARIQSLVMDPDNAFSKYHQDLLSTFSDGTVALLDVPCGCGAASISLLVSISLLREHGFLPRLPLNVSITGGDFSEEGLSLFESLLLRIQPHLRLQGIHVQLQTLCWDATRADQTANLVDHWFSQAEGSEEYYVLVANFSGAATRGYNKFENSFRHFHERLHNKPSTVIWVEPTMKGALKFLSKIRKFIAEIPWFGSVLNGCLSHEYRWFHPLQEKSHPCRLMVEKYTKTPGGQGGV